MKTINAIMSRLMLLIGCVPLLVAGPVAHGQAGSVLIWPVDPVIKQDERAVGLWLENKGQQPVQLQMRVFAWNQPDGENRHTPQTAVVGTPPMLRIDPGKRQFVRLTRMAEAAAGRETAYRVIIDEIPPLPGAKPENAARQGAGIRFQMRYSIPLFVYGKGMEEPKGDPGQRNTKMAQPMLSWRTITFDGVRYVEVRNTGGVHARLVDANFLQRGATRPFAPGLLGYVLAGVAARFPLPEGVDPQGVLVATVNTGPPMEIPRVAP